MKLLVVLLSIFLVGCSDTVENKECWEKIKVNVPDCWFLNRPHYKCVKMYCCGYVDYVGKCYEPCTEDENDGAWWYEYRRVNCEKGGE